MGNSSDDPQPTERTVSNLAPRHEESRDIASLVVIRGDPIGQRIDVRDSPVLIGRSPACDLQIQHPSVSRTHCRIWREGGAYRIRDLQSTNKTYLNAVDVAEAELRDGDHITIGETIVKFVGEANVESRYHEELYRLATRDALTELYNRRRFRELLDLEVTRAAQAGYPLALALIDIDHFKQINDRHGHDTGDKVLRNIAGILRELVDSGMILGRLGGEEFGAVLPKQSAPGAAFFFEEVRRFIEDDASVADGGARVTVSVGVAEWRHEMLGASDLLRAADTQLYRAKGKGRNQVCAVGDG